MKYILSIILVIVTINIYSQDRSQWSRSSSSQNFQIPNMVVKGKLIDSESNDGLSYATISVITADSILISGGITDDNGKFKIEINPRKMMEKIRMERNESSNSLGMGLIAEITYIGYKSKKISNLLKITRNLPSLIKSQKIQEEVSKDGFDFKDVKDCISKLQEEIREFNEALETSDNKKCLDEGGDILFSSINVLS